MPCALAVTVNMKLASLTHLSWTDGKFAWVAGRGLFSSILLAALALHGGGCSDQSSDAQGDDQAVTGTRDLGRAWLDRVTNDLAAMAASATTMKADAVTLAFAT